MASVLVASKPPASTSRKAVFKIATSIAEREAAFRLVYRSYLRARLIDPNPFRMRVTPFHLLPTTTMFVAQVGGRVISTVSLVGDGDMGLPMESMYADAVQQRREQGMHVGEVTCLADRRRSARRFLPHFCRLTRLLAQYARSQGLHQLLAVTHPKHARFYSRYMGFTVIGGLKACPHVRDNPAVALCLDFARVDREPPKAYRAILGDRVPAEDLVPRPLSARDRNYFQPLVDPCFDASVPEYLCTL